MQVKTTFEHFKFINQITRVGYNNGLLIANKYTRCLTIKARDTFCSIIQQSEVKR